MSQLVEVGNSASKSKSPELGTFEHEAIKKIVRESWQKEVHGKKHEKELMAALEAHAQNMRGIINSIECESLWMQNVTANTKFMKESEAKEYVRALEALAAGYSYVFEKETLLLVFAGLAQVLRDSNAAKKHLELFIGGINSKALGYAGRVEKSVAQREILLDLLESNQRGFLRFFRKRKIARLRVRIGRMGQRLNRYNERAARYALITKRVREMAGGEQLEVPRQRR